jgi:hypothetical protein
MYPSNEKWEGEKKWRERGEGENSGDSSDSSSDTTLYFAVPSRSEVNSRVVANLRGEMLRTKGVNTAIDLLRGAADLLKHVIKIDVDRLSENVKACMCTS